MHFGDASIEAEANKRPLFLQFSSFGQVYSRYGLHPYLPDVDLEDNGIYQTWYKQNRAYANQRTCKNQKYGKTVAAGMVE